MKAILIDDEQLAVDFLERQLQKTGHIEVIGKFSNAMVGKEKVLQSEVDVIFLDINMPGISGLDLAGQIIEIKPHVSIVFVTAYDEYAVSAFEINALDYIVKPIQLNRLNSTIDRIKTHHNKYSDIIYSEGLLYINVSGQLKIGKSRHELEMHAWRTAKAQELFLYLLENRHRLIRKSVLTELLWPTFDEEKAHGQLYTAIYHVRRVLHKFGTHIKVKNKMDGYILELKDVWINLNEWEMTITSLGNVNQMTVQSYEDVMALYTGTYLEAYDYVWAESERYRLDQLWLKTSFQIASFYQKEGQIQTAIDWYKRICHHEPEAEEAHFALMKNYNLLNYPLFVEQQYIQLVKILDEEFSVLPSAHIANWYKRWKSQLLPQK